MKQTILFLCVIALFSQCGRESAAIHSNNLKDISYPVEFFNYIENGASMAYFYRKKCKDCKEQRTAVERAAGTQSLSFAKFVEVNRNEDVENFSNYLKVTTYPTILFFKNGYEHYRLEGKGHSVATISDILLSLK